MREYPAAAAAIRATYARLAVDGGPVRLTVLATELRDHLPFHVFAPCVVWMAQEPDVTLAALEDPDPWDWWDAIGVGGVKCHVTSIDPTT